MGTSKPTPATGPPPRMPAVDPLACENAWLAGMRNKVVAVRLTDGKGLTGVLVASDRGTIAVRVGDEKRARIIYKRAIAYVMEQ